jgi:bifunctional NMN adenylyltransferase/nudix hydrolase
MSCFVFIARAEPPTLAHLETIKRGLAVCDRGIVVIGSHERARGVRNPFTSAERIEMITGSLPECKDRLEFLPLHDSDYHFSAWLASLKAKIAVLAPEETQRHEVYLMSHKKDDTSYYLDHFPEWKKIEVPTLEGNLSATQIRRKWLAASTPVDFSSVASPFVNDYLSQFRSRPEFKDLRDEFLFAEEYRKVWACAPYPPIFVVGDNCVFCQKNILLIRRGQNPGKGLYAVAGGFLNPEESLETCAVRELLEETIIDISEAELRASIVGKEVFDDPHRDPRGRVVSHSYCYHLKRDTLPQIHGGDDAAVALWMPTSEMESHRAEFAGDHFQMIRYFMRVYGL